MGIFTNIVAAITATAAGFSSAYAGIEITPPEDKVYNFAQRNTEQSSMIARGSNLSAGIVTIDRAKGNAMTTNDTPAHRQFELKTLAKLPIIIHAVRVDPGIASGDNADAIGMIQGFSSQDTTAMWEEYGGISIIQDLAERYDLEETTAKTTWHESTMSAVDVGRMIRRFMDDEDIKDSGKKWVLDLMKTTPLEVSGEDMSWGIPAAMGFADEEAIENSNTSATWAQGWSPSGEKPMVRHSVGMVGDGYRFIVVAMGQISENTSNQDANRVMTQTVQELISGGDETGNREQMSLGAEEEGSSKKVESFMKRNEKYTS